MLYYRGVVRVRNGHQALAWVKAENQQDAEDLLGRVYGDVNVGRVDEMRDLETYQAEVKFPNGDAVPTVIWAQDEADARRSLRILYGGRRFRMSR